MTISNDFDTSLDYLLEEEGGWSNHPSDKGGATFNGVTQGTYDQWRGVKKLPKQSVRNSNPQEIKELYEIMYWRAAGCDRFPFPINYFTFDAAVNSGPDRAVKWTQQGLGLEADGKVGPLTVAAAKKASDTGNAQALLGILLARSDFLSDLVKGNQTQLAFLKGWWRRTLRVLARGLVENS